MFLKGKDKSNEHVLRGVSAQVNIQVFRVVELTWAWRLIHIHGHEYRLCILRVQFNS